MAAAESKLWFWLSSGAGDPAVNMATDEALLDAMPRLAVPILRFYSWTRPTASFGYFQSHAEVERLTRLRPLVRRPTAGGIVPHDADWTYSLSIPGRDVWYELRAVESYKRMHEWIQRSLSLLGVVSELADRPTRSGKGQCFVGYEQFDLLCHGRKVAGAAQRRCQAGLLIQGSVQPSSFSVPMAEWEQAMRQSVPDADAVRWVPFALDRGLRERIVELAGRKYSQSSWNAKR